MLRMNHKLVLSLLTVLLISSVQIFAQDLKSAIYLSKSQQYEAADKAFSALIKSEPANGNNYFYQGENIIKQYLADTITVSIKETADQANPIYKKGIEADTANALNLIGLGRIALLSGDRQSAKTYFGQAFSKLPKYKKISKIKEPQKHALVLAKLAEALIVGNSVDTAKALPYAREAQAIDPNNPEIFMITGDVYMVINDASAAIKNYNRAKDLDKNSCEAAVKIGNIYRRAENLQVAIPNFEEAIKIDAKFAPAYLELGELYNLAGQSEKAKTNFKKYLELSGNNFPAKVKYITALYKSKDYEEALKNIEEVLAVDKSKTYLIRLAAYCQYDKKKPDYNKALTYIEDFFKVTPQDKLITKDYAYYGKTILKIYQDYPKAAPDTARMRAAYAQMLNKRDNEKNKKLIDSYQPKLDSIQAKLNTLVAKLKVDSTAAQKGFDKLTIAFNMDTTNNEIMMDLINFYYGSYKRYGDAAKYFQKVIAKDKEFSVKNHEYLGKCYYYSRDYNKAVDVYTKITKSKPDYIPAYSMLATTYASLDPDSKLGLAKPHYEELITKASADTVKNAKDLVDAYNYFGSYYLFTEVDNEKAKMYFNKIVAIDPKNKTGNNVVKGYTSLAYLYTKAKDYNKAKECYEKILEVDPKNGGAQQGKADIEKMKK